MIETMIKAINMYGQDMQLNIAIEEMAELTKEICKYKRGAENTLNIAEEMADCYIMLKQIEIIIGLDHKDIEDIMAMKIDRLEERMRSKDDA